MVRGDGSDRGGVDGGKAEAADKARVEGEPGDDEVGVVEVGAGTAVRRRVGRCPPCSFVGTDKHISPKVDGAMEHQNDISIQQKESGMDWRGIGSFPFYSEIRIEMRLSPSK